MVAFKVLGEVVQADLPVHSVEQILWWSFIAEAFSMLTAFHSI